MPLAYAAGAYLADGEEVSAVGLLDRRDDQIDAWADELQAIARDALGDGERVEAIEFPASRIESFASRFLARVGEIVIGAYVWAAGGAERVTEAGWQAVAGVVERQMGFGRGFVAALRSGELSAAQAAARAGLYAGAAVESFERGKAGLIGVDLPLFPGMDCEGGANCRCWWEIVETANGIEATWHAAGDKGTCGPCASHAREWNPYRAEEREAA